MKYTGRWAGSPRMECKKWIQARPWSWNTCGESYRNDTPNIGKRQKHEDEGTYTCERLMFNPKERLWNAYRKKQRLARDDKHTMYSREVTSVMSRNCVNIEAKLCNGTVNNCSHGSDGANSETHETNHRDKMKLTVSETRATIGKVDNSHVMTTRTHA